MNWIKYFCYRLYEYRLRLRQRTWTMPKHIGIIMDGNRRYARELGLGRIIDGHRHGANKLLEVLQWCLEVDIQIVTIWAFALDNFHREPHEVRELLELLELKMCELLDAEPIHQYQVKLKFIGNIELLPVSLQEAVHKVERATEGYKRLYLNMAIAYGGREEITEACRRYFQNSLDNGEVDIQCILQGLTPKMIDTFLYTAGLPEPDLIIRTSGEVRLSGFLLWQSVYSEFYFCDTFWPKFRKIDFLRALRSYHSRRRRYGR